MPTARQSHDVTLASIAASPLKVGLTLVRHPVTGKPEYWSDLAPGLPAPYIQGEATDVQYPPEQQISVSINDWHRGFGQYRYDSNDPGRYGYSNGVDARAQGELSNWVKMDGPGDFLMRNPGVELGTTAGWTAGSSTTLSVVTAGVQAGTYALRATYSGSMTDGNFFVYQDLTNPTAYQSREIKVGAWIRRVSGSTHEAFLSIDDGVTISNSAALTTGTTYTYYTVTKTLDGAATRVRIGIRDSTDTIAPTAITWEWDSGNILPTGGVVVVKAREFQGSLYQAVGRIVAVWDETNDVWNAVYIDSANVITDMETYQGSLYIAMGSANVYRRSSTGGVNTFAVVTASNPGGRADFFARGRNASGAWALFKGIKESVDAGQQGVYASVTPSDSTTWGTKYIIGDDDRDITGLHAALDTVIVGKEDGPWLFESALGKADDPTTAAFAEAWDLNVAPSSDNFERGIERAGWFYTTAAEQSLMRYNPALDLSWQDLSWITEAAGFDAFGGRVRAFAQDMRNLYIVIEEPVVSTSTSKVHWLIALREEEGELHPHTMKSFTMGDVYYAIKNDRYLYIFGRTYNSDLADYVSAIYRFGLPTKHQIAYKDVAPLNLETSTTHITPWYDCNFPADQKSLASIPLHSKNLTGSITILVEYQVDDATDASAWTNWGTYDTSPRQIKTIPVTTTLVNARRIRFRWTLTGTATVCPVVTGFFPKFIWNPPQLRQWVFSILSGRQILTDAEVREDKAIDKLAADINTLRLEPYLDLVDILGTAYKAKIRNVRQDFYVEKGPGSAPMEPQRILTLHCIEVPTT